jgi:RNA polymerase sigma factor (sigma-70 family)
MFNEIATDRERDESRGSSHERQPKGWTDTRLVRECLKGEEGAWSALVDKYKNLIYSIPVRYGFSSDDASDIFQAVCLELLAQLPKLREPNALAKWIIQITAHTCCERKRQNQRIDQLDETHEAKSEPASPEGDILLREAEEEHQLRLAMAELPPRCRELVRMLFFEEPAREYREIARSLGVAVGSIGFIRQRCLEKLRRHLAGMGF